MNNLLCIQLSNHFTVGISLVVIFIVAQNDIIKRTTLTSMVRQSRQLCSLQKLRNTGQVHVLTFPAVRCLGIVASPLSVAG